MWAEAENNWQHGTCCSLLSHDNGCIRKFNPHNTSVTLPRLKELRKPNCVMQLSYMRECSISVATVEFRNVPNTFPVIKWYDMLDIVSMIAKTAETHVSLPTFARLRWDDRTEIGRCFVWCHQHRCFYFVRSIDLGEGMRWSNLSLGAMWKSIHVQMTQPSVTLFSCIFYPKAEKLFCLNWLFVGCYKMFLCQSVGALYLRHQK